MAYEKVNGYGFPLILGLWINVKWKTVTDKDDIFRQVW